MKRLILTIVLIILISCSAKAEQLPGYKDITRKDNPVLCKYLTDYAIYLNNKLKIPFYLPTDLGDWYIATFDRNGVLIEERYNPEVTTIVKDHIRQVLKENPPPPLPDELEGKFFTLQISLYKSRDNLITFMKYNEYNYFRIEIDKRNNFPRKVKPNKVYLKWEDKIPGVEEVDYVLIPGREQFYQPPPHLQKQK